MLSMASCFRALRPWKKSSRNDSLPLPSSSSTPPPETEDFEKMRWNSMESWSMLLESDNLDNLAGKDAGAESEEWAADLSQLFIGNKFASGAHSRIYRGIYKQRAVAVKVVRIPDRDEETRARLEKQFSSEVALLSRLNHPNIVQNARPPLADNCSHVLANLIKRCWDQNPAKRPDFNYIVSVLEKYDQCLREGNPHLPHVGLSTRGVLDHFMNCIPMTSSIPVHA